MTTSWSNWAGNQTCAPGAVVDPTTEEELAGVVRAAAAAGRTVKAVGAGHSFTDIACTDGVQVRLGRYRRVLGAEPSTGRVTVEAGIPLAELNLALHAHGLALPNLGDIAYQSVAGAVATATHGTGARLGGLATQVVGLSLIAGDGSVVRCSAAEEPEIFACARVGLGALGIVSTVTLQAVPAFNLHVREGAEPVDGLLERLDDEVDGNDHFEFFYVPHTGRALTKRNNRTDAPLAPRPRARAFAEDHLLRNVAFGALCRTGRRRPSLIPRLNRLVAGAAGSSEHVDVSWRVFASPRLVRFYEMEYAIPRPHAVEALRRVRAWIAGSGCNIGFPIEVRFVAGDDIALSTAAGRETCYIAVHVYRGMPFEPYFRAVEAIMDDYGGRPHWGKLHFQDAVTLAPRYPGWDRFQAVRRRLDPEGRFRNAYLDRVLGSPA